MKDFLIKIDVLFSRKQWAQHAFFCLVFVLLVAANYFFSISHPFVFDSRYMLSEGALAIARQGKTVQR